jgi:Ca2+-binding RTX toxin-like protein
VIKSAVRGQTFDAMGSPVGSDFIVNTIPNGSQTALSVFSLAGDSFAVSWHHLEIYGPQNQYRTTFVQHFKSSDSSQVSALILSVDGEATGSIFNDKMHGDSGSDILIGEAGDDILSGGGGVDILNGYTGNDILCGGTYPGKSKHDYGDTLIGGEGSDTFIFNTLFPNSSKSSPKLLADHLVDFQSGVDSLVLIHRKFKKAGPPGVLDADAFAVGRICQEKNDRILYNPKKNWLYYDRDGSKKHKPIVFAVIENDAEIEYSDIVVA